MKLRTPIALASVLFGSCSAIAADAQIAPPSSLERALPNWNGFYLGAVTGVSRGMSNWSQPTGQGITQAAPRFPAGGAENGILVGGTIGFNHQTGSFLFGIETDLLISSAYGAASCGGVYGVSGYYVANPNLVSAGSWRCENRPQLTGSVAPRLGYATGNALFYAKAGAAFGVSRMAIDGIAVSDFQPPRTTRASDSVFVRGWLFGIGAEYALDGSWSAKIEYTRIQLASNKWQGFQPDWESYQGAKVRQSFDLVKFGLNYRWGDATARPQAPVAVSADLSGEFGGRLGMSLGNYNLKLGDPETPAQMNSRLPWNDLKAASVEAFGRLDHSTGFFLKGIVGGLGLIRGNMLDEDFLPDTNPYSRTTSKVRSGNGLYATADVGWSHRGAGWRLAGFLGYSHNQQQKHAYGCVQIATNNEICSAPDIFTMKTGILSRHESWNGLRIGLAADMDISDKLTLSVDAAYQPKLNYRGRDNHWARSDINPMIDTGSGHGYQLEAIASYKVSERVALGIGARRWTSTAKGSVTFPNTPPSPISTHSSRTTVFVQATYRFGHIH